MITKKFKFLALALIFSGALNIGLIAAFAFCTFQETLSPQPLVKQTHRDLEVTNGELIAAMSKLSFRELVSMLTNREPVEEGYAKRDIALASLAAFHHFNIEKALSAPPSQVRTVVLPSNQKIDLFPALTEDQFAALIRFAYQEKWPLTARGLFALLPNRDESLEQAFLVTPEFHMLQVFFQKTGVPQAPSTLLRLVSEGSWELFETFVRDQSAALDFSVDKRRSLLLSYLSAQSPTAAELFLSTDFSFALKKLEDRTLLDLLALLKPTEEGVKFCRELLRSTRSDPILEAAAKMAPEQKQLELKKETAARIHVVKEGDTLWKIARQYKVKVDDVVRLNGLGKDALFPGMMLKLPQGTGSEPPL